MGGCCGKREYTNKNFRLALSTGDGGTEYQFGETVRGTVFLESKNSDAHVEDLRVGLVATKYTAISYTWGATDTDSGTTVVRSKTTSLANKLFMVQNFTNAGGKCPQGQWEYPFMFKLPMVGVPSMRSGTPSNPYRSSKMHGEKAVVTYKLVARLKCGDGDVYKRVALTMIPSAVPPAEPTETTVPFNIRRRFLGVSGFGVLKLRLENPSVARSENLRLNLKWRNASNVMPFKVIVQLEERVDWYLDSDPSARFGTTKFAYRCTRDTLCERIIRKNELPALGERSKRQSKEVRNSTTAWTGAIDDVTQALDSETGLDIVLPTAGARFTSLTTNLGVSHRITVKLVGPRGCTVKSEIENEILMAPLFENTPEPSELKQANYSPWTPNQWKFGTSTGVFRVNIVNTTPLSYPKGMDLDDPSLYKSPSLTKNIPKKWNGERKAASLIRAQWDDKNTNAI